MVSWRSEIALHPRVMANMARGVSRRPPPRRSKTVVWHGRDRVGTLTKSTDGAIAFAYDDRWLTHSGHFPIATSLSLFQQKWQGDIVMAVFDNLLPDAEGDLRAKIAERIGAPGRDVFSLLSELGRDCVGAFQFLPPGETPGTEDMDYRLIDEAEMARDLQGLAVAPLAMGDDEDFRISIAGAQEKTAYLKIEGSWGKPRGITPTSHIFKTPMGILPGPEQIDLSDSVENELFCMTLAGELGLPVAKVDKLIIGGRPVLAVERFDRLWEAGILRRLPQEDCCQSLGIPSSQKYQKDGGPGIADIMELLRESDRPTEDRETFFAAQIFFYLIGASDGHAKNFSLRLRPGGGFRLAPLYDILSLGPVIAAGRLQRKRYRMAMSIDGRYGIDELTPRHFEAEGRANRMQSGRATELLLDFATHVPTALDRTVERLGSFVPERVSKPICLEAGQRAAMIKELLKQ